MGLIDDIAIADDGIVTHHPLSYRYRLRPLSKDAAYITDALSPLAGITSVQVKQTLDKLWTDDRVKRRSHDVQPNLCRHHRA